MKKASCRGFLCLTAGCLTAGLLVSCGGAGGGGISISDGGIRGTGSSVGPVSGFGSVFVNGIRFDTDSLNGQVQSDDGISTEAELDEGMILRVDGQWRDDGQGTAAQLEYDDTLRGEIVVTRAWDDASKTATLSIYGLTVHIDNRTVLKGTPVTELADGDFVRVSAWRLANGEFRASFVRTLPNSAAGTFDTENAIELEGQVENFDPDLCQFEMGNITVECDADITDFDGISLASLAHNPFIEVEGHFNGDVLFAREIEEDDRRRYRREGSGDIEFAGPVNEAFEASSQTFVVNGLIVRVNADTEFGDGLSADDLVRDLLVQVEGDYRSDGTVLAGEIELREGEAEVEGRIGANSVNFSDQTFRIGGVLVQVTPLTAIVGDEDRHIDFQSLGGPEEVEVSGIERTTASGSVYLEAFKVEVDDEVADGSFELVGRLSELGISSITVLGVTMQTDAGTEVDDTSLSELRDLVESGERPLVEVEYVYNGISGFRAEEIELEEEDDD